MRVLLKVAYDGTEYSGWQIQPNAETVEGVLTETVSRFFGREIKLTGASRTDAGVHAFGNVAVFDIDTKMPAEKIAYALNTYLPKDIRIQKSAVVPDNFHPRKWNCRKTYEYRIYNDTFENPLFSRYSHFYYGKLDIESMKKAAEAFVGEHDFSSFCAADTQALSKIRTIYSAEIEQNDKLISFRVTGNGFLYNMVRILSGTLILAGAGKIIPSDISEILEARDRSKAGPTAPAEGLVLVQIEYEGITI